MTAARWQQLEQIFQSALEGRPVERTAEPAVRIYVATGTTDLRRSIDAFSLKSKVRTIKKARSGMAIA